jgi:hypothetical protein
MSARDTKKMNGLPTFYRGIKLLHVKSIIVDLKGLSREV